MPFDQETKSFPSELLNITGGLLSYTHDCWTLQLTVEPFDLPYDFGGENDVEYEQIETDYSIDLLGLPPESFAGKKLSFEIPNEQVDGSIFLVHAHHPVDIVELDAIALALNPPSTASIRIKLSVDVMFEGLQYAEDVDYDDFTIDYELQLTPQDNGWSIGPATPLTVADS